MIYLEDERNSFVFRGSGEGARDHEGFAHTSFPTSCTPAVLRRVQEDDAAAQLGMCLLRFQRLQCPLAQVEEAQPCRRLCATRGFAVDECAGDLHLVSHEADVLPGLGNVPGRTHPRVEGIPEHVAWGGAEGRLHLIAGHDLLQPDAVERIGVDQPVDKRLLHGVTERRQNQLDGLCPGSDTAGERLSCDRANSQGAPVGMLPSDSTAVIVVALEMGIVNGMSETSG